MKTFLIGLLLTFGLSAFGAGEPIQRNYFTTNHQSRLSVLSTNVLYASQWGVPKDGITSVVPYIQRMTDQCTNGPIVVFLDGPRYNWNSGRAVELWSNVIVTAGAMGTTLSMSDSNNCPFFQNKLNTNYLNSNITLDNLIMDQRGTNQATMMYAFGNPLNGTCAASGTNIYTTTVVFAGVSNLAITRCEIRNPTSYGTLVSCARQVLFDRVFINYVMRSQCGGDGYHFWGAVDDVRMYRCRLNAHEGDGIAINLSETSQLGRSQFWATNSNYCHNFVVDDFEMTCPPGAGFTGSTFMNIQCGDDAWSHVDNVRISNVRIDKCATVFRRIESCDTLSLENCQVVSITAGPSGFGDVSTVLNLTLKNIRFAFAADIPEMSPPVGILLGSGQVLVGGVVANMQSVTQPGFTLFGVSGATNTVVVSGVNLLGGAGVFQNMDVGNPYIRYSASYAPSVPMVYDNSGTLGAPILTNIFGDAVGPVFIPTNWIMNTAYVQHFAPEAIDVIGECISTEAANVDGTVRMDLVVDGRRADFHTHQTALTGLATTNSYKLNASVPYGSTFYFTNLSVGAGNSTTLLPESSGFNR